MKIRKTVGNILKTHYDHNVFCIYWIKTIDPKTHHQITETCYWVKRDIGASIFRIEEVTVIDPTINFKAVFFQIDDDTSGIMHWALAQDNFRLFFGVSEGVGDIDANNEFLEIIKSEGLVDEDFY